jgi:hypothetical protein
MLFRLYYEVTSLEAMSDAGILKLIAARRAQLETVFCQTSGLRTQRRISARSLFGFFLRTFGLNGTDLPPLKWSSLKYGFDHGG